MSIPLVERVDFQDEARTLNTLWGLLELRDCLIREGANEELDKVRNLLSVLVTGYSHYLGNKEEVIRKLVESGFLERNSSDDFVDQGGEDLEESFGHPNGLLMVGITGLIQSGKGTLGKILSEEFGGFHGPFVDGLVAYAYATGNEPDDRAAKRRTNDLIKPRFGKTTFAKAVIKRSRRLAEGGSYRLLSFDGLRSEDEARLFLGSDQGVLVAVSADVDKRYARAVANGMKKGEKPKSYDEFVRDSELEERTMMGPAIGLAEIAFDNNHEGVEYLREQVRRFFRQKMGDKE